MPFAPKATDWVPENEQVPFSAAQEVYPAGAPDGPGLAATGTCRAARR